MGEAGGAQGANLGPREARPKRIQLSRNTSFLTRVSERPKPCWEAAAKCISHQAGKPLRKLSIRWQGRVGSLGCCCLPEPRALHCGVRNQPRTKPSLPGHPVCPREQRVGACVSSFKERDKPLTPVPRACLGRAQHAAPGAQRSPGHCSRESEGRQESQPSEEQRACGKTSVPHSLCGEKDDWLLRKHEGTPSPWARAPF